MTSKLTIMVIGAAVAGIKVSHGLLKQVLSVRVILINPHKDYYFNITSPRVMAKPDAFSNNQYLLLIEDAFSNYPTHSFQFIQGIVMDIEPESKQVVIAGPEVSLISYDYLVVASGSTTSATIGKESALVPFKATVSGTLASAIKEAQQAIREANSIIIGGAGAVGVEFAGELAEAWAGRGEGSPSITLVSATEHVLPRLKDAAGMAAERLLKEKGVQLLLSRKVTKSEQDQAAKKWIVTLDGGEVLTADLYVSATGVTPNSSFIPSTFLDRDGWLEVDDQLRVQAAVNDGKCTIYALGDITSHPYRDGYRITDQVHVVVTNLKSEITGHGRRATYTPSDKAMALVPVGKSGGTGQFGSWVPWSFLVSFLKGRDFFVSRASSFIRE